MNRSITIFRYLFGGLIVLISTGCAMAGTSTRADAFLGDRAVKILAGADRVEVFRVTPTWEKSQTKEKLAGYPLISTGKEQGKEFGAKLSEIVRDDSTYEWNIAKACEFAPGVAYRVWSGKESIIVLICFHCDQIGVIPDESTPTKIHVHDFDAGRAALVKLARTAFPDDKVIQGLKD